MAKQIKTNAMRLLDSKGVAYQAFQYIGDEENTDGTLVARKNQRDTALVHKTLVVRNLKNELYVFVIPIGKELDLKKAAQAAGEKKLEMLPHKDLMQSTGYVKGACSPIGMKKPFKTFIDAASVSLQSLIVSAGKIGHIIEISVNDLCKVLGAELRDVTKNAF